MSTRNHIQDELARLQSNLPATGGGQPYFVPEGYFEGLAAALLERVSQPLSAAGETAALSPLLAGISRRPVYSVPGGYFESALPEEILSGKDPESAVLAYIGRDMPYDIPFDYFDNLPQQMLARVQPPTGKIIRMEKRRWMRMAVAAIITGIVAFSGYFYMDGKRNMPVTSPDWVSTHVKNVSNQAIEQFVKTTDVTAASTETVQNGARNELKAALQEVSDRELDAFLSHIAADDELFDFN